MMQQTPRAVMTQQSPASNNVPRQADHLWTVLEQFEQTVTQLDAVMAEHLQRLRGCAVNLRSALADDRLPENDLPCQERAKIEAERAQQQEQLRGTLSQLTEAWLRLEAEQRELDEPRESYRGQPAEPSPSAPPQDNTPVESNVTPPAPTSRPRSALDVPPSTLGSDSANAASLFHKLRLTIQQGHRQETRPG